jgi:glycosyltransferase involved in cell wall biosynthesis
MFIYQAQIIPDYMKVHTVIPYFHPTTGGVETRVLEVSKRFVKRGWDVVVHTAAHTPDKKVLSPSDNVEGIEIRRYKPKIHRSIYLLYFKPKIDDGDIIDLQSYENISVTRTAIRLKRKYPIFLTTHLIVTEPKNRFWAIMKSMYNRTIGIRALRSTYRTITITDVEKDWCAKIGADPSKIISIPNGVGAEAFESYDAANVKEKYGLKRYILFIGRMYAEKGPVHLVSAFFKISKDHNDVSLVFVGPDQGETAKVNEMARQLKLEDRVICTGRVPKNEKYELLSGCEFFVLPSMYEAQGIVFIEAWAQKKAVIGTRVGGVPNIIAHGENGLLYDYGDIEALARHLKHLLEDPQRSETMGKKGYETAQREYGWDEIVDRIERLYEEALRK